MLSSFGISVIVCLAVGVAIVVRLVMKAQTGQADGTIARVLYDAEHPEKSR
jgi:hypothetical protein